MSEESEDLEAILEELRTLVRDGLELERQDLRRALLPIGELCLAGREEEARLAAEDLRDALSGAEGAWEPLLEGELALACAEHVHSVDPRYLELANYDLDYTRAARRRLAARLEAARLLGHRPSAALLAGVEKADRILESRFGAPPPLGDAGPGAPDAPPPGSLVRDPEPRGT